MNNSFLPAYFALGEGGQSRVVLEVVLSSCFPYSNLAVYKDKEVNTVHLQNYSAFVGFLARLELMCCELRERQKEIGTQLITAFKAHRWCFVSLIESLVKLTVGSDYGDLVAAAKLAVGSPAEY